MQKEAEKFKNSTLFEGLTSIRAIIEAHGGKNPQNDRRIERIVFAAESEGRLAKELSWLSHRAREEGFPLVPMPCDEIAKMSTGSTHGGLLAECGERTIPSLAKVAHSLPKDGFYAMIEGIEDPYNFG